MQNIFKVNNIDQSNVNVIWAYLTSISAVYIFGFKHVFVCWGVIEIENFSKGIAYVFWGQPGNFTLKVDVREICYSLK